MKKDVLTYIIHDEPLDFYIKGLAKYCKNMNEQNFDEIENYINNFLSTNINLEREQRAEKLYSQLYAARAAVLD